MADEVYPMIFTSDIVKMANLKNSRYKKLPLKEDTLTLSIDKLTAKIISNEKRIENIEDIVGINNSSNISIKENMGDIVDKIDSLEKSVSDGKSTIASAITEMGIGTKSDDTFDTMAKNIKSISSDCNATESDILSGKKAYVKGKTITGNIPNIGEKTYTPGTANIIIPSKNYLSGSQTIKGDSNLIPENIIEGKTIFNILGTGATSKVYEGRINAYTDSYGRKKINEQYIEIGFQPDIIIGTLANPPSRSDAFELEDAFGKVIIGEPIFPSTANGYLDGLCVYKYQWYDINERDEALNSGGSWTIYTDSNIEPVRRCIELRDNGFYIISYPDGYYPTENFVSFTAVKWKK